MPPHHREHSQPGVLHETTSPPVMHTLKSFAWSHPPKSCSGDDELDPITRLEWLDDLMFAAIDGDPVALDCAADAWNQTLDELGEPALEESRQQYVRHAQTVWKTLRYEPNHPPHKVFAAIEIISLLVDKSY